MRRLLGMEATVAMDSIRIRCDVAGDWNADGFDGGYLEGGIDMMIYELDAELGILVLGYGSEHA